MANRAPFEIDEWYHCYNRGVEKRIVFQGTPDYDRFLQLLYLANDIAPLQRFSMGAVSTAEALRMPRTQPIVAIGAYALMSNHFHLLLKEIQPGGITQFMRKLGTAYTMYFNLKNERTGNLFMKPFRSKHVIDDRYLQWVVRYIHCNTVEIFEPDWKEGKVRDLTLLEKKLMNYHYSSLPEHYAKDKPTSSILDCSIFEIYKASSLKEMLEDARLYYGENVKEL